MNEEYYTHVSIDRSDIKVPANPIPYNQFRRFRYRLVEMSKDYPERNEALLLLQSATGYRAQDIVDLTIGDIRQALEDEYFLIQEKKQIRAYDTYIRKCTKEGKTPSRKKPKQRYAELYRSSETYKFLQKYIKGKKNSEYAFKSKGKYGHITAKSYSKILREVGLDLGLDNISGHSPRKTYATTLYDDTRDIVFVSRMLGHKSTETTEKYIGIYKEERRKAASIIANRF